ncbi:hypothetical protein ABIB25_001447 [Nakamurella sp. UYEF19]|uniref:DUF2505 domain-containing protein n=1 Tax=Nakamurella sp. UYEF19 TaxID=1756392 RepID=UPI003397926E
MPTSLSVTHEFTAAPAAVFSLFTDRAFLDARLEATGGTDPSVVSLEKQAETATVVIRQSIPSSALPSMVASMISGDPVTERTENWRTDGEGYQADFTVVIKGAPASLKGTMALVASGAGSTFTVDGQASVPIPLFGGKIEAVVVEQVDALLVRENEYTATALTS